MRENIYDYVMSKLDARVVPLVRVSRETGIPYESLKKIAHRRTPNPGVKHVQTLADFFDRVSVDSATAAPANQAQAAINSEAMEASHA
jgi:hypothetical protein